MEPTNPHRLPKDVVPSTYRVAIDTDLAGAAFNGTVAIDAEVLTPTDRIVCNSAGLRIHAASVTIDGRAFDADIDLDADTERLVLTVGSTLEAGPVSIHLSFSGALNDQLVGFYRSAFTVDDRTEYMAVTQFEAPYARRAFPCWDEPEFKATFEISLTCAPGLTAISNAPEIGRTEVDGRVRFDFAPTMVMSTYLVAWVIGELEVSDTVKGGSTDIRVIHRPGKSDLTAFALECAAHAVSWFEAYYGIDYPGDKLDLLAVPDFAFGAMENLGCVTFRENLLLIDPLRASRSEQERAATVIEHEIAHMWFGDLVTMDWWNGIWLNEAFATFMEFCCADDFRPEWEIWTSFGLSKSQAFDTDALAHTRPIEFEVVTPADAEAMFDILTYEKGASVLRMFERWAGPESFRDGIRTYLALHSYRNTETSDLWRALAEATSVDVEAMMNTWILQGGHPLVSVESTPTGIKLTQQRFSFAGGDPAEATSWIVPIRVEGSVEGSPVDRTVLLDRQSVDIDLGGTVDWVNVNSGFTGFYRTRYDATLRSALVQRAPDLSSLDRYALLDDAWALFLADRLDLSDLVATIRAVAAVEDEPSVWRRIAGVLHNLASIAHRSDRPVVADLTRSVLAERPLLPVAPSDSLSPPQRDLRAVMFRLAGTLGNDPDVIDVARRAFAETASGSDDPDLDAAVLDVVAAHGSVAEFEDLVVRFRAAATPQDELRALSALAQFPSAELTSRLCEMCATEVRTQNAPYALAQAMGNPDHGPLVWRFVAERWDALLERFPSSSIIRMVGGIRSFADADLAGEIEAFFRVHDVAQARLTLDQHLERVRVSVAARHRLGEGLADKLR